MVQRKGAMRHCIAKYLFKEDPTASITFCRIFPLSSQFSCQIKNEPSGIPAAITLTLPRTSNFFRASRHVLLGFTIKHL
jgi:hypothetical protein